MIWKKDNYIESSSYPDRLTISGFGANQFIVTVQPDPALVQPREMAFSARKFRLRRTFSPNSLRGPFRLGILP